LPNTTPINTSNIGLRDAAEFVWFFICNAWSRFFKRTFPVESTKREDPNPYIILIVDFSS